MEICSNSWSSLSWSTYTSRQEKRSKRIFKNLMKIRPVILCGGAGTRLWPNKKHHQAKQFIDFGNWTLFGKTLERIKNPLLIIQ